MDVLILGARGHFVQRDLLDAIARVRKARGVVMQAFDARAIYGRAHLDAAIEKAQRAHARGDGIAKDLATEIACYAAGAPQISRALALVGVPLRGDDIVVVALGPGGKAAVEEVLVGAKLTRDDTVLRERAETLDLLGIPATARAVVPREEWALLVVERVALVDARS